VRCVAIPVLKFYLNSTPITTITDKSNWQIDMNYWIIVASKDPGMRGVTLGIAQAGNGKHSGLARMHKGDMIVYYSPKV